MISLLAAVLLSQGWSGSPPGVSAGRTLASFPLQTSGLMIAEDANTVAHVYWNGSALVDTKSNTWTQNGTVPQVTDNPFTATRYGAGPFSDANYYSAPISFEASDFSMCAVLHAAASGTIQQIVSQDTNTGRQVEWNIGAIGTSSALIYAGVGGNADIPTAYAVAKPTVACISYQYVTNGTSVLRHMVNLVHASSSVVGGPIPAATAPLEIGRRTYPGNLNPLTNGRIYEVVVWKGKALSQAEMTTIQQKVLGHLDGSAPLTVTRATDATYLDATGKLWTAASGVARITNDGLLVEPARTNYAINSNALSVGTAANTGWTAVTATVATVADAPLSGTWAELTSTVVTGSLYQTATTASTTTTVASAWMAKASGTGYAGVISDVGAGTTHTSCSCLRSDGGTCTATITPATLTNQYCLGEVSDLGTTPVRLSVISTANVAGTAKNVTVVPGRWGVSTGTTRFTGAQLEIGTYPTSLIVTAGTAVARNADQVSATIPMTPTKFCWAVTGKPEENMAWLGSPDVRLLLSNSGGTDYANLYLNGTTDIRFQVDDVGASNRLIVSQTQPATGARRVVACNSPIPLLSLSLDGAGVPIPLRFGTGTGLATDSGTTMSIGHQGGTLQFGGYLKNLKICAATSEKECK